MQKQWLTAAEIVAIRSPDLPATVQGLNMLIEREKWRADQKRAREASGRGRSNWQYHVSLLPAGAQARLALMQADQHPAALQAAAVPAPRDARSKALWSRFEALSKNQKGECQRRLDALFAIDSFVAAGLGETAAAAAAAVSVGVSTATLFNWKKMVRGVDRADWLAALAPGYVATATHAECHPLALEMLKSDWLRPEKPSFSACYRRMRKAASAKGWLPIPSERALRRRIEAEVARGVRVLAREGEKKAKTLYPAQQRTRVNLHAMQAVNMDGHELDVFVRTEDGRVLRLHMLAIQDLYSGKLLAWRLSETENKETVRLVIGDMVERYGIPDRMVFDNGRAFASKWISGGMPNRFRFKIREGDPRGLLTTLGVDIHWAKPYSGQSKPIERAFRDLAENIAKHPFCAGAYTGNRPEAKPENYGSRAIPVEAFRDHVARQIAEHNNRPGRRMETCAGRSFDETFAASMALPSTIVRWPTESQKMLWLLAAEKLRARPGSGEIHFHGNRYWAAALNAHAGQPVVVRFDPDRLQEALQVYTVDDRFICRAECIAKTGFFDAEAARTHARDRGAYEKALKEQRRITAKMSIDELARLMGAGEAPAAPAPMPPKVKRVVNGPVIPAAAPQAATSVDFEESFSRGLRLLGGDADVIPFTPKRSEDGA